MKAILRLFNDSLKCRPIYIIDLVQDNVKLRLIIPLAIVFYLYCTISYLFQSLQAFTIIPSSLKLLLPASENIEIGYFFDRYPIVMALDQFDNPIENITVSFSLKSQTDYSSNYLFNCDNGILETLMWTSVYLRALGPCSIEIADSIKVTDIGGYVKFETLKIIKGSEGHYVYSIKISDDIRLPYKYIYFSSPVKEMKVLNDKPLSAKINITFVPQPLLLLQDKLGSPVINKTIEVISRSFEDCLEGNPLFFNPFKDQLTVLIGSTSQASNSSGITTFNNLKIAGSVLKYVYILFCVDGTNKFIPWISKSYGKLQQYIKTYITPIVIDYGNDINIIEIIQEPSKSVIEGNYLQLQPILKVSDQTGKLLKGIICFAKLKGKIGNSIISGEKYQKLDQITEKMVLKPISAIYNESIQCLEWVNKECVTLKYTDKNGVNIFEGLGITHSGNINDSYTLFLTFHCGRNYSIDFQLMINSSIDSIRILSIDPLFLESNIYANYFDIVLHIQNKEGVGILGKQLQKVTISRDNFSDYSYGFLDKNNKSRRLNSESYSNQKGILHVQLQIIQTKLTNDCFNITVSIEKLNNSRLICTMLFGANSNSINNYAFPEEIPSITLNNSLTLDLFSNKSFLFHFLNLSNKARVSLLNTNQLIDFSYKNSRILTNSEFVNERILNGNNYISNGQNISFNHIKNGSYFLHILPLDENLSLSEILPDYSKGRLVLLNVINEISQVEYGDEILNNVTNTYFLNNPYEVIATSIIIKDNNGNRIQNHFINKIDIVYYQFPEIYSMEFYSVDWDSNPRTIFQVLPNSGLCDLNGSLFVNISLKEIQYSGLWVIGLLVDGIYASPIQLLVKNPIDSLSIISFNIEEIIDILNPLSHPLIVKASSVNPKYCSKVPIIALFHVSDNNSDASIDIDDPSTTNSVWNIMRLEWTDDNGISYFNNLTILGITLKKNSPSNCTSGSFYFQLATNSNIISEDSKLITFCISISLDSQDPTDNQIFYEQPLIYPFNIFMEAPNTELMDFKNYFLLFSIRISNFKSTDLTKTESIFLTNSLLKYSTCVSVKGEERVEISNMCSIKDVDIGSNSSIQVYFKNLYLNSMSLYTNLDFTICYFDFCIDSYQVLSNRKITTPFSSCYSERIIFPDIVNIDETIALEFDISSYKKCIIPSSLIHCNIHSLQQERIVSKAFNSMMDLLSNSIDIVDTYNLITKYNGTSELNTDLLYVISRNKRVSMTFKFDNVNPGFHLIQCASVLQSPIVSSIIYLNSSISRIEFDNDQESNQTIFFNQAINGDILSTTITLNKNFTVVIFNNNSIPMRNLQNYIIIEANDDDFYKFFTNFPNTNTDNPNSTFSILYNLYKILLVGTSSLFSGDQQNPIPATGNVDYSSSHYYISNISFLLESPTNIRIRVYCRGVYSAFAKEINILQSNYSDFISFCVYYQTFIFLISILFIIIFNSIHFQFIGLIIAIIISIFNIIVYVFANYGSLTILYGTVILGILIIILIYALILQFLKGNELNFYVVKSKEFAKYFECNFKKLFIKKREKNIKSHKNEILINSLKSIIYNKDKTKETFIPFTTRKKENIFRKIWDKIKLLAKHIFTPDKTFFYSQRFLMSILICIFILILCVFEEISLANQLINLVSLFKSNLYSTIYSALSSMIETLRKNLNHDLTVIDMDIFIITLNQVTDVITSFIYSFYGATITSNVLILFFFACTIILAVKKFKRVCLKSRSSMKTVKKLEGFELDSVYDFPGLILGLAAVSYIVECFLLTVIFTLVFNKLFWSVVWEYRLIILIFLFPTICLALFKIIFFYFTFKRNRNTIINRNILQLVEIIELIFSIINGVGYSSVRLIFSIFNMLVRFARFDKSTIEGGFNLNFLNDELFESYMSCIRMQSLNANPIYCHSVNIFIKEKRKKISKAHKKVWLAYLIYCVPSLKLARFIKTKKLIKK